MKRSSAAHEARGVVTTPPRPEPIGGVEEHGLVDRVKEPPSHLLNHLVFDAADLQGTRGAGRLGNLDPSHRLRPVRSLM
jgi:hypothetical protein